MPEGVGEMIAATEEVITMRWRLGLGGGGGVWGVWGGVVWGGEGNMIRTPAKTVEERRKPLTYSSTQTS